MKIIEYMRNLLLLIHSLIFEQVRPFFPTQSISMIVCYTQFTRSHLDWHQVQVI